jgi:hypothetical protein
MPVKSFALLLIGCGALLVVCGLVLLVAHKLGIPLGHLPGDVHAEGKHWTFNFPIVTCLLLSLILTLLLNFLMRR